ncbi:cysteine hydrolase [Allokutzneria sp. A3M-2-11 16]|uniref:cysteine hydrolase family protein n=1 Tax=Allokutzneria sp. A3M-2-11 16 TaxID=2962043 RepID=UPI0020B8797A|nr:cysteine hydrolase family protein [Allokutzneria sp. A3M-2-11 16]MCP3802222.1 cysteine hydrolase [Allokutzneria sp. A3M-2-11 16]
MPTTTLRELNGLDKTPASLATATLVLVDYQNTYTQGVMELTGWGPALDNAAELLAAARKAGTKVVHVIHDSGEGTPFDIRADIGQIHPRVAPVDGEHVVVKGFPNSFTDTELGELVDASGNTDVIIAGFMTHMCVAATAAGAFLRGTKATVVADACASRPLQTAVSEVPADQVHHGALAMITDLYGVVVPSCSALG